MFTILQSGRRDVLPESNVLPLMDVMRTAGIEKAGLLGQAPAAAQL